jgi:hypothetical protein
MKICNRLLSATAVFSVAIWSLMIGQQSARADDYALLDRNGKKILTTGTSEIQYVGSGIYLCHKPHRAFELFNRDGVQIPLSLPEDCKLVTIAAEKRSYSEPPTLLPADALIEVSKVGLHGILTARGDVVLPIEFDQIRTTGPNMRIVSRFDRPTDHNQEFLFNTQTKHVSKLPLAVRAEYGWSGEGLIAFRADSNASSKSKWGYVNEDNEVIIPPAFDRAGTFTDGLAIVQTGSGNGHSRQFIDHRGSYVAPNIKPLSIYRDGVAIASSIETPDLFGLVDRNFHFIVQPTYKQLQRVANAIYAAKGSDLDHFIAISPKGRKLFDFPKQVQALKCPEDDEQDLVICDYQTNPVPTENRGAYNALITKEGKVTVASGYWAGESKFGLTPFLGNTSSTEMIGGVLDTNGKWIIPMHTGQLSIAEADRIIEVRPNLKFDNVAFKTGRDYRVQFARFLQEYDLIGMSRKDVVNLLGPGQEVDDVFRYDLNSARCGNAWEGFEIDYENERVKRWRFAVFESSDGWITENVIFDPRTEPHNKLIPKNAS